MSDKLKEKASWPLATWEFTLVGSLGLKVDPLVIGESCGTAKPLAANLTGEGVVLLMDLDVCLQVVDRGEATSTPLKLTSVRPLLVMRLEVTLQLVRGGKGPTAAFHGALVRSGVLCVI